MDVPESTILRDNRETCPLNGHPRAVMLVFRRVRFGSPAPWTAFEEMAVVEQAVEHGSDRRAVAEQFSPVF